MFCKKCGRLHTDFDNYCQIDGASLQEAPLGFQVTKLESLFCSSCGKENKEHHNYCHSCGQAMVTVDVKKEAIGLTQLQHMKIPNIGSGGGTSLPSGQGQKTWINAAIYGLLSFIIVAILSTGLSAAISKQINEAMVDGLDLPSELFEMDSSKVLGISDVIMSTYLVNSTITVEMDKMGGELSLNSGFVGLLIIPFLGLFIAGFILGKRQQGLSILQQLKAAAGLAGVHAIILGVFSLFAGISMQAEIPFAGEMEISNHYSFFQSLFNGFVIGFLFSCLGLLASNGSMKVTGHLIGNIPFGESVHQGFSTIVRGIFVSSILVFILFLMEEGFGDFKLFLIALFLFIPQLGTYLWNVFNFNTFTAEVRGETFELSVFDGFKFLEDPMGLDGERLILYFGVLAMVGLYLWAGKQMKASSQNLIQSLLVFSVINGLLMSLLVSNASLSLSGKGGISAFSASGDLFAFGFSFFMTFILNLVLSFGLSYLGAMILPQSNPLYKNNQDINIGA